MTREWPLAVSLILACLLVSSCSDSSNPVSPSPSPSLGLEPPSNLRLTTNVVTRSVTVECERNLVGN